jgi:hypothetical protein
MCAHSQLPLLATLSRQRLTRHRHLSLRSGLIYPVYRIVRALSDTARMHMCDKRVARTHLEISHTVDRAVVFTIGSIQVHADPRAGGKLSRADIRDATSACAAHKAPIANTPRFDQFLAACARLSGRRNLATYLPPQCWSWNAATPIASSVAVTHSCVHWTWHATCG